MGTLGKLKLKETGRQELGQIRSHEKQAQHAKLYFDLLHRLRKREVVFDSPGLTPGGGGGANFCIRGRTARVEDEFNSPIALSAFRYCPIPGKELTLSLTVLGPRSCRMRSDTLCAVTNFSLTRRYWETFDVALAPRNHV